MIKRLPAIFFMCFVSILNSAASSAGKPQTPVLTPEAQTTRKTEYLIKLQTILKAESRKELFKKYNFEEVQKVGSTELYLVRIAGNLSLKEIQDKIKNESTISYIEPHTMYHTQQGSTPHPTE